jgi:hypothetical protein
MHSNLQTLAIVLVTNSIDVRRTIIYQVYLYLGVSFLAYPNLFGIKGFVVVVVVVVFILGGWGWVRYCFFLTSNTIY